MPAGSPWTQPARHRIVPPAHPGLAVAAHIHGDGPKAGRRELRDEEAELLPQVSRSSMSLGRHTGGRMPGAMDAPAAMGGFL